MAGNIKSGVKIFNVTGSLVEGVLTGDLTIAKGTDVSGTTLARPVKFILWVSSYSYTTSSNVTEYAYVPVFVPSTGHFFLVNGTNGVITSTSISTSNRQATIYGGYYYWSMDASTVTADTLKTLQTDYYTYEKVVDLIPSVTWSSDLKTVNITNLYYIQNSNYYGHVIYSTKSASAFVVY